MQLTNEKIEVTNKMMESNGMTRGGQFGIPVDPQCSSKGLSWKNMIEMSDDDFDKIEEYFLQKKNKE